MVSRAEILRELKELEMSIRFSRIYESTIKYSNPTYMSYKDKFRNYENNLEILKEILKKFKDHYNRVMNFINNIINVNNNINFLKDCEYPTNFYKSYEKKVFDCMNDFDVLANVAKELFNSKDKDFLEKISKDKNMVLEELKRLRKQLDDVVISFCDSVIKNFGNRLPLAKNYKDIRLSTDYLTLKSLWYNYKAGFSTYHNYSISEIFNK